ncbi:Uncharacterised protein [Mycobacterium tuberculosis]|nr:Uncharacterised protein [Mycobacterium tuberculosis]
MIEKMRLYDLTLPGIETAQQIHDGLEQLPAHEDVLRIGEIIRGL